MQKEELDLKFQKKKKKKQLLSVNLKQMPQQGDVPGFFSVDQGERSSWIWADALGVKSISPTNAKDGWLALDMIKTAASSWDSLPGMGRGRGSSMVGTTHQRGPA